MAGARSWQELDADLADRAVDRTRTQLDATRKHGLPQSTQSDNRLHWFMAEGCAKSQFIYAIHSRAECVSSQGMFVASLGGRQEPVTCCV